MQHDEEAEGESDDQDQVVAQALDQVHGDCVEHQTDASSQQRISKNNDVTVGNQVNYNQS